MEVYSLWVCRFGHSAAAQHTHMHTIVGVFPLEGKVSFPLTFILSLRPPLSVVTPLHTSFLLDLFFSFIHRFVSRDKPPPISKGKKESVKDTAELANSNEKLRGRGQSHHRGQLWLRLCTY